MAKGQVIATAKGHDGKQVREIGDVFEMDSKFFERRAKIGPEGKPTGEFYAAPSWFEKAIEKVVERKVMAPAGDEDLT